MKRIVVIPDSHLPAEDRRAMKAVISFIGEYNPDEVVQIGDLMDYPQPSRWSKGTAAEFEGSVFADSKYARERFCEPLREVYSGPVGVIEGNHDLRARDYLQKYAPALAESGAFNLNQLLEFDRYGIKMLPPFYKFTPGWVMTHGHLGGISLSAEAGHTALNAAKRFGASVIMGHVHRLALKPQSFGFDNRVSKTLWGFEVGHLMDMNKAHYLKGAAGNWQQGFGVVHIDGGHVSAQPIHINAGKFTVDGVTYTL